VKFTNNNQYKDSDSDSDRDSDMVDRNRGPGPLGTTLLTAFISLLAPLLLFRSDVVRCQQVSFVSHMSYAPVVSARVSVLYQSSSFSAAAFSVVVSSPVSSDNSFISVLSPSATSFEIMSLSFIQFPTAAPASSPTAAPVLSISPELSDIVSKPTVSLKVSQSVSIFCVPISARASVFRSSTPSVSELVLSSPSFSLPVSFSRRVSLSRGINDHVSGNNVASMVSTAVPSAVSFTCALSSYHASSMAGISPTSISGQMRSALVDVSVTDHSVFESGIFVSHISLVNVVSVMSVPVSAEVSAKRASFRSFGSLSTTSEGRVLTSFSALVSSAAVEVSRTRLSENRGLSSASSVPEGISNLVSLIGQSGSVKMMSRALTSPFVPSGFSESFYFSKLVSYSLLQELSSRSITFVSASADSITVSTVVSAAGTRSRVFSLCVFSLSVPDIFSDGLPVSLPTYSFLLESMSTGSATASSEPFLTISSIHSPSSSITLPSFTSSKSSPLSPPVVSLFSGKDVVSDISHGIFSQFSSRRSDATVSRLALLSSSTFHPNVCTSVPAASLQRSSSYKSAPKPSVSSLSDSVTVSAPTISSSYKCMSSQQPASGQHVSELRSSHVSLLKLTSYSLLVSQHRRESVSNSASVSANPASRRASLSFRNLASAVSLSELSPVSLAISEPFVLSSPPPLSFSVVISAKSSSFSPFVSVSQIGVSVAALSRGTEFSYSQLPTQSTELSVFSLSRTDISIAPASAELSLSLSITAPSIGSLRPPLSHTMSFYSYSKDVRLSISPHCLSIFSTSPHSTKASHSLLSTRRPSSAFISQDAMSTFTVSSSPRSPFSASGTLYLCSSFSSLESAGTPSSFSTKLASTRVSFLSQAGLTRPSCTSFSVSSPFEEISVSRRQSSSFEQRLSNSKFISLSVLTTSAEIGSAPLPAPVSTLTSLAVSQSSALPTDFCQSARLTIQVYSSVSELYSQLPNSRVSVTASVSTRISRTSASALSMSLFSMCFSELSFLRSAPLSSVISIISYERGPSSLGTRSVSLLVDSASTNQNSVASNTVRSGILSMVYASFSIVSAISQSVSIVGITVNLISGSTPIPSTAASNSIEYSQILCTSSPTSAFSRSLAASHRSFDLTISTHEYTLSVIVPSAELSSFGSKRLLSSSKLLSTVTSAVRVSTFLTTSVSSDEFSLSEMSVSRGGLGQGSVSRFSLRSVSHFVSALSRPHDICQSSGETISSRHLSFRSGNVCFSVTNSEFPIERSLSASNVPSMFASGTTTSFMQSLEQVSFSPQVSHFSEARNSVVSGRGLYSVSVLTASMGERASITIVSERMHLSSLSPSTNLASVRMSALLCASFPMVSSVNSFGHRPSVSQISFYPSVFASQAEGSSNDHSTFSSRSSPQPSLPSVVLVSVETLTSTSRSSLMRSTFPSSRVSIASVQAASHFTMSRYLVSTGKSSYTSSHVSAEPSVSSTAGGSTAKLSFLPSLSAHVSAVSALSFTTSATRSLTTHTGSSVPSPASSLSLSPASSLSSSLSSSPSSSPTSSLSPTTGGTSVRLPFLSSVLSLHLSGSSVSSFTSSPGHSVSTGTVSSVLSPASSSFPSRVPSLVPFSTITLSGMSVNLSAVPAVAPTHSPHTEYPTFQRPVGHSTKSVLVSVVTRSLAHSVSSYRHHAGISTTNPSAAPTHVSGVFSSQSLTALSSLPSLLLPTRRPTVMVSPKLSLPTSPALTAMTNYPTVQFSSDFHSVMLDSVSAGKLLGGSYMTVSSVGDPTVKCTQIPSLVPT
jgi:hypothetical protein